MLTQMLFFNISHFALTVFSAFTFFAAGLLHLDSWQVAKSKKTLLVRSIGFFFLALATATHASSIFLPLITTLIQVLKIGGLILIFSSLVKEPIIGKSYKKIAAFTPLAFPAISFSLVPLSAALLLLITLWYFRKSTEGMEKQLKPAAVAFLFLALAEFVNISFFQSNTTNVFWSKLLADFGTIWIIHSILELIGTVILMTWVWGYIRFRLQIQLFATIVGSTLLLFLTTTFFFTFLLLKNLESDALGHLKTDVNVLQYALNRLQLETLSHAEAVAQDSNFQEALNQNNPSDLYKVTSKFMLSQGTSFLAVTSASGEVLMRAEDKDKVGDNISEDPIVKSALANLPTSTIIPSPGVTYPEVLIKAAVPIKGGGALITGFIIDSAFVDGVKKITGLDIAVFADNTRAATTFVAPDGKSRFVGTSETNKKITDTVLGNGQIYIGTAQVLNQPYLTAYSPLKTFEDKTIGMLFVGKPQTTLLSTAQKSIDLTSLGSIILMILSIAPAYFLSKYIEEQIEA